MAPGRGPCGQCPSLPRGPSASSSGSRPTARRSIQSAPTAAPAPAPSRTESSCWEQGRAHGTPDHLPGRKAQLCLAGPRVVRPLPRPERGPRLQALSNKTGEVFVRIALLPLGCLLWGMATVWLRPVCPHTRLLGDTDSRGLARPQSRPAPLDSWEGGQATPRAQAEEVKCVHLGCPANPLGAHPSIRTPCTWDTRRVWRSPGRRLCNPAPLNTWLGNSTNTCFQAQQRGVTPGGCSPAFREPSSAEHCGPQEGRAGSRELPGQPEAETPAWVPAGLRAAGQGGPSGGADLGPRSHCLLALRPAKEGELAHGGPRKPGPAGPTWVTVSHQEPEPQSPIPLSLRSEQESGIAVATQHTAACDGDILPQGASHHIPGTQVSRKYHQLEAPGPATQSPLAPTHSPCGKSLRERLGARGLGCRRQGSGRDRLPHASETPAPGAGRKRACGHSQPWAASRCDGSSVGADVHPDLPSTPARATRRPPG